VSRLSRLRACGDPDRLIGFDLFVFCSQIHSEEGCVPMHGTFGNACVHPLDIGFTSSGATYVSPDYAWLEFEERQS